MERYLQRGCVKLKEIIRIEEYFEQLNKIIDCIVIFAIKDTLGFCFNEKLAAQIKDMGLEATLCKQHWKGYIGIVDNKEKKFEILGEVNDTVEYAQRIDDLIIEIKSSPYKAENVANIYINGIDYAVNKRGINIVVYDKMTEQIVDSVCFDTHVETYTCNRKPVLENHSDLVRMEFEHIKNKLTEIDANINQIKQLMVGKNVSVENRLRAERLKIENIMSYDRYVKDGKHILVYKEIAMEEIKKSISDKIKVRIFFWGNPTLWNTLKTVAESFQMDDRYDVLIIIEENLMTAEKIKIVTLNGLRICLKKKYNINDDMPDMLILNSIQSCSLFDLKKVKYTAVIPFVLVNGGSDRGIDTVKAFASCNLPYDALLIEKFLYEKMEARGLLTEKIYIMGNPKFDGIYKELHKKQKMLDEKWNKMNKVKRVVLLATDHCWDISNVTFDLYIHYMLYWFAENREMGLIIRPHQSYPLELMDNNVWSKEDFQKCKDFCNSFENIIWDDSDDYSLAYSIADAILTDVNCGITISALSLNKPLGTLRRFDGSVCKPIHPEVVDKLYCIDSIEKCTEFLEMIQRGEDVRYDDRQQLFEKYVSNFDGKNGQRIKEFIEEKYNEKCMKQNM